MDRYIANRTIGAPARILCLGNDLLADDALGGIVAEQLRQRLDSSVDVVFSANTGFSLIDYLLNTRRLIVVDTVLTGNAPPGSVLVMTEEQPPSVSGGSPHYVGLFEALSLARKLDLPAADQLVIVAVEAADCTTVGGAMTADVLTAVPGVVQLVLDIVHDFAEVDRFRPPDRGEAAESLDSESGR